MRNWVLIPHFYQPPTQSPTLTELILRSCYLPFLDLLLGNPRIEMSINLSASLILALESIPNHNFFPKIHELVARGQIEFLNSAIFHPIIPLTPESVVLRQTQENAQVIERFCKCQPVSGFFPPELAIDQKSLNFLTDRFDFVVVDESSINPNFDLNIISANSILLTGGSKTSPLSASERDPNPKDSGIASEHNTDGRADRTRTPKILISSRSLTEIIRAYPTELRADSLIHFIDNQQPTTSNQPLVCATDVEVFGHHYTERINLLKDLFASTNHYKFIKATTALNQSTSLPDYQSTQFVASSWQASAQNLRENIPFALWNNPSNKLQQKYFALANMAFSALRSSHEDPNSHIIHSAEHFYDQGISSCHPYWLSNTPWWHPDMVELGARNLVKCIRTLPISSEEKRKAEVFYHNFMLEVWDYHWSGEVEENYKKFEKNRLESLTVLPKLE